MSESTPSEPLKRTNEATKKSQGWLKRNAENIKKWAGNLVTTGAGEFFTVIGGIATPLSIAASVITANPVFLLGAAPSVLGGAIEWGGAKKAGGIEKSAFVASKLAMAGGAMYSPLAPVAMGVSAASGALIQRHRT